VELNDGVTAAKFADDEADEGSDGKEDGAADPEGTEPVRLLAFVEDELEGAEPKGHEGESEVVDGAGEFASDVRRVFDEGGGKEKGEDADGEVDVEDPAPGVAVGDPTTEGGADDGRDDDADAVDGHGGTVFAGRKAFEEDGLGEGLHASATDALENAGEDEHRHVDGESAEEGSRGEEDDGKQKQALASDAKRDPAGGREHDGVGDEVAGENPGSLVGGGGEVAGDVGRATLATEESRTTMKVAVMTERAIIQRLAVGVQGVGAGRAGGSGVTGAEVNGSSRA